MKRLIISVICYGLFVVPAAATHYYIDPASGAIGNAGTAGSPWSTLAEVTASKSFTDGDTVHLLDGYHGAVSANVTTAGTVVFIAEDGAVPVIKSLYIGSGRGLVFDGLTITPEADPPYQKITNIITMGGSATRNTVKNCLIYSIADPSGWSASDWDTKASSGFRIDGPKNIISNNMIKNIRFGVFVNSGAESCLVEYNTVTDFCEDGLRGIGHYGVFQYNLVKNAYDVSGYHEDGFQSWSLPHMGTGSCYGIVLRGNHFLCHENMDHPFRAQMQGIGCFDGFFEDWVVENNLVVTDHWHGITLMGARDCIIINNTVVTHPEADLGPSWIQITNHKQGDLSTGNIVRNNICTDLDVVAGTVTDHNIYGAAAKIMVNNYYGMDFTLRPGMPAFGGVTSIDGGSTDLALATDILGVSRPQGGGIDLGCYEYVPSTAVRPVGYQAPVKGISDVRITDDALVFRLGSADRQVTLAIAGLDGRSAGRYSLSTAAAGEYRLPLTTGQPLVGIYVYTFYLDGKTATRGRFCVR